MNNTLDIIAFIGFIIYSAAIYTGWFFAWLLGYTLLFSFVDKKLKKEQNEQTNRNV